MVTVHLTSLLLGLLILVEAQTRKSPKPTFKPPQGPKIPESPFNQLKLPLSLGLGFDGFWGGRRGGSRRELWGAGPRGGSGTGGGVGGGGRKALTFQKVVE
ncbi:uncharacterized protein LOC133201107 [Saccostrea echinata]|uniref:uncharacterized protein LOC133201107 n=1 Tax=Saccostrea echinata TaxID=191078 RepID=UPI002A8296D5|nr:uncharacterized protein LOC133201107 [Saccostrea echinata]